MEKRRIKIAAKALIICVTEADHWEYEDRRDRIGELCAELIDRGVACSGG
jgi:hypothetical protein